MYNDSMYETIKLMIKQAEIEENYSLIEYVKQLIDEFSNTINCPSNWRDIGERLAKKYDCNSWIYAELSLWDYEEEEND